MTLEAAFTGLTTHLQTVHDELLGLQTAIREDKPADSDIAVIDMFGDAVDDLLGCLDEAIQSANLGRQAIRRQAICFQASPNQAWHMLRLCHEQLNRVLYQLIDIMSYERLAPLIMLANEHGGEWVAWVPSIQLGLNRCRRELFGVINVLLTCWQEVVEQAGSQSTSIRADAR